MRQKVTDGKIYCDPRIKRISGEANCLSTPNYKDSYVAGYLNFLPPDVIIAYEPKKLKGNYYFGLPKFVTKVLSRRIKTRPWYKIANPRET